MKKISTSTLQRPMVICLLAAFCCLLWGSAFPAVKIGYGLLSISPTDTAEQLIFAGLRFFFAGAVTVLFRSASLRRLLLPARSSLWKAAKLGLIQTFVQYALFYIGMAHTSGVKGSVLMAVHVFFAILISAKLFHYERLNAPKLLGCLCGFGGVLLINLSGGGLGGGFTLLGDGAVLLAALANGFSNSLFKRYAEGEDTLTLCGYQFIVGGGLLLLTGLCFGGTLPHFAGGSLLLLGYMVLLSAVAQTVWSALTRYNPVGRVAVYGFFEPRVRCAPVGAVPAGGTAGLYPVQFSGIGTGMRGNFRGQPQRCPRQGSAGRSATITGKGTVPVDRPFSCGRAYYIHLRIWELPEQWMILLTAAKDSLRHLLGTVRDFRSRQLTSADQPKGAFEALMMCSTWRKSCISPAIPLPSICACWRNTGSSSRNGRRYR